MVSAGTDVVVDTNEGTDAVLLTSVSATGSFTLDLGSGKNDAAAVVSSSAPVATLDGGDDSGDILVKSKNHFGSLTVTGFEHVTG